MLRKINQRTYKRGQPGLAGEKGSRGIDIVSPKSLRITKAGPKWEGIASRLYEILEISGRQGLSLPLISSTAPRK